MLIHVLKGNSIRSTEDRFQHSPSTVSKVIKEISSALIKCSTLLIDQFRETGCPSYIRNNPRFYPYFKDCVGAFDGSHISAVVSEALQKKFRNRKGWISQNVLGVIDFRMIFTYILPGWEGSAHDGKVLQDALLKGLEIVPGKYWLGDAGYALTTYSLTPYHGVRYHLKEWRKRNLRPQNKEELFNLRHSSLRNVIERGFGVIKKRFPILCIMMSYSFEDQIDLVCCCFILNNLIRIYQSIPDRCDEVDDDENGNDEEEEEDEQNNEEADANVNTFRDTIAQVMWNDYLAEAARRNV